MKIVQAKNPHYTDRSGRCIHLDVLFDGFDEWLPFAASPDDSELHGRELYLRAKAGEFGEVGAFAVSLDQVKTEKKQRLKNAFTTALKNAHCLSSAGFEIDADETASRNIDNLLAVLAATGNVSTPFRAYDNTFHTVTMDDLKRMLTDIALHRQRLYVRKWALEKQIGAAETAEAVEAIVISFDGIEPVALG